MKRIVTAALALAFCLMPVSQAYAADENVEFGVADDLTVLGTEGLSSDDPDVEIKGFTVFGATEAAKLLGISKSPGNVWVNGEVQIEKGMYVTSATITGVSTFTAGPAGIFIQGGTDNQVLKKNPATGAMMWADDNDGSAGISGTPDVVPVFKPGSGFNSSVYRSTNSHGIVVGSMTIQGDGTVGLKVTGGASDFNGSLSVLNANTFTVGTGLTSLGGALNVTGAAVLSNSLSVIGDSLLNSAHIGSAAGISTFTSAGNIYVADGSSITLYGAGAQIYLPNAPVIGNDAANKDYVDSRITASSPWVRDDSIDVVKLSTTNDRVGIGVAAPMAKLHVSSSNAESGDSLFLVSSGTAVTQQVFGVDIGANGVGEVGVKGNLAIGRTYAGGSAPANGIAVEGAVGVGTAAPDANTQMQVVGGTDSGNYVAKFYSGSAVAAWIRKK